MSTIIVAGSNPHVFGSTVHRCDLCSTELWLSPSSQSIPDAVIVCFGCADHVIDPETDRLHFTPHQIDELRRYGKGWG